MTPPSKDELHPRAIPSLRNDIEAISIMQDGMELVLLRDPQGYAREMLQLSPEAWGLVSLFNGEKSALDIHDALARDGGIRIPADQILEIASVLDRNRFLNSPEYLRDRDVEDMRYAALPVRAAAHAGTSYPENTDALNDFFSSLFSANARGEWDTHAGAPRAVITPHIDLQIGPEVYVPAFEAFAREVPETVVIFGTSHYSAEDLFILTEKHYETPFGIIETDLEFVQALRRNAGDIFTRSDIAHKPEHSIEFPVLFLQHLFSESQPRIVPVLCTSFEHLHTNGGPRSDPRYKIFIDAFHRTVRDTGRNVRYVLSVDWSHVGRKFGDNENAAAMLSGVRQSDLAQLQALERLDYPGFAALIRETGNATRIDGFSCISTFFDLVSPTHAQLLAYDFWHEEERASAVTYASMAFWED